MYVNLTDLQQFSDGSRLTFEDVSYSQLETTYVAEVLGRLNPVYDTSLWVDSSSTPQLVKSLVSALIVAALYERQYSEDSAGEGWYPDKLRRWVYGLLKSIAAGETLLIDAGVDSTLINDPSFFPNDFSETDGLGNEIKFKMSTTF